MKKLITLIIAAVMLTALGCGTRTGYFTRLPDELPRFTFTKAVDNEVLMTERATGDQLQLTKNELKRLYSLPYEAQKVRADRIFDKAQEK